MPLILPYFHALATSHREIDLSHRTIRGADDIAYYVSKISRNAGAFLYFACHGKRQRLSPSDGRSTVAPEGLLEALSQAKAGAIAFVHFGCCEMVAASARRQTHEKISQATGARWVSGYTTHVGWLQSTLLDIALVSEVFVPDHQAKAKRERKLKPRAEQFIKNYEQLARELGFSALAETSSGQLLFPELLHTA